MTSGELDKRFGEHPPGDGQIVRHRAVRAAIRECAEQLDSAIGADSREKSLAMTSLKEAQLWAFEAVTTNG